MIGGKFIKLVAAFGAGELQYRVQAFKGCRPCQFLGNPCQKINQHRIMQITPHDQTALNRVNDVSILAGLGQKVLGCGGAVLNGDFVGIAGKQYAGCLGITVGNNPQEFGPVHFGHPHVGNHHICLFFCKADQRTFSTFKKPQRPVRPLAHHTATQSAQHVGIVINKYDRNIFVHGSVRQIWLGLS